MFMSLYISNSQPRMTNEVDSSDEFSIKARPFCTYTCIPVSQKTFLFEWDDLLTFAFDRANSLQWNKLYYIAIKALVEL